MKGTRLIQRRFGVVGGQDVGELRLRSGTKDAKVFKAYNAMLDALASPELARGDLLVDLRDGRRTFPEVYERYRAHKLDTLAKVANRGIPLQLALDEWVEVAKKRDDFTPINERTKRSYRNSIRQLMKHAKDDATIRDLPTVLKAYGAWCAERDYRTPFRQAATMCRAYVRRTQPDGQFSDLYREIAKIPLPELKRKRERNALRVYQVVALMKKLPQREADHVWNLTLTGARIEEYERGLVVRDDRILIQGTKTDAASRFVPIIDELRIPTFARSTFVKKFRKAGKEMGLDVTPHDLRSTFKRIALGALGGENIVRVKQYFGHATLSMTEAYDTTHDITTFLEADGDAMRAFVERDMVEPKADHPKPKRTRLLATAL